MKKKVIGLLLSTAMVASMVVGCGGSSSSETAATETKTEVAKTDKAADVTYTAGVTFYKFDDTFMTGARNALTAIAEGSNVSLEIADSQGDSSTQNDKVNSFITKGVNALAINLINPTDASAIVDKAKENDIPIVFFNNIPDETDMNKYDKVYHVGSRAEQSGIIQGTIVADYFKAHPEADKNGNGKIDYVMIQGLLGGYDATMRTKHSIEEIQNRGFEVNKIAEFNADWDRSKAQDQMASIIAAQGDQIEVVISNNDDMALGAIEALKAAGYLNSDESTYIPVVGVDASAAGCQAIKEGTLLGSAFNNPVALGESTFKLLQVAASGETPTQENTSLTIEDGKYVWLDYVAITADNVDEAGQ